MKRKPKSKIRRQKSDITPAQRKAAELIVGTLSAPSKMPCHSYNTPASECITGTKLRDVEGSTCSDCYACKGRYPMDNVQTAMRTRFNSLESPYWVDSMVTLIRATGESYFRWHDSGDLQSVQHFARIVHIAELLPNVQFWLPTREYKIVADFRKVGTVPANLTVRLSAHMVNAAAPNYGLPTSTVHTHAHRRIKVISAKIAAHAGILASLMFPIPHTKPSQPAGC